MDLSWICHVQQKHPTTTYCEYTWSYVWGHGPSMDGSRNHFYSGQIVIILKSNILKIFVGLILPTLHPEKPSEFSALTLLVDSIDLEAVFPNCAEQTISIRWMDCWLLVHICICIIVLYWNVLWYANMNIQKTWTKNHPCLTHHDVPFEFLDLKRNVAI